MNNRKERHVYTILTTLNRTVDLFQQKVDYNDMGGVTIYGSQGGEARRYVCCSVDNNKSRRMDDGCIQAARLATTSTSRASLGMLSTS